MNNIVPEQKTALVSRLSPAGVFRQGRFGRTMTDQKGSMILIALMLLTIMSIIGIASINTTVTESFIVRNTAIRKQNIQLADAVAGEALQRAFDAIWFGNTTNEDPSDPIEQLSPQHPSHLPWVIDPADWATSGNADDWWDPEFTGRLLTASPLNSEAPSSLRNNRSANLCAITDLLISRGEWVEGGNTTASPVRYALLGWRSAPGSSLKLTEASRRAGEVLTEYVSERFGVTRLTIGLEMEFPSN